MAGNATSFFRFAVIRPPTIVVEAEGALSISSNETDALLQQIATEAKSQQVDWETARRQVCARYVLGSSYAIRAAFWPGMVAAASRVRNKMLAADTASNVFGQNQEEASRKALQTAHDALLDALSQFFGNGDDVEEGRVRLERVEASLGASLVAAIFASEALSADVPILTLCLQVLHAAKLLATGKEGGMTAAQFLRIRPTLPVGFVPTSLVVSERKPQPEPPPGRTPVTASSERERIALLEDTKRQLRAVLETKKRTLQQEKPASKVAKASAKKGLNLVAAVNAAPTAETSTLGLSLVGQPVQDPWTLQVADFASNTELLHVLQSLRLEVEGAFVGDVFDRINSEISQLIHTVVEKERPDDTRAEFSAWIRHLASTRAGGPR